MIEVVGIGASGWASLGPVERDLVTGAELVVGAPRHLDLLPPVAGPCATKGAVSDATFEVQAPHTA